MNDLQSDIDRIWKSERGAQEQEYFLPSKTEYVCFVDFSISSKGEKEAFYDELKLAYYGSENMVFYPVTFSELDSTEIKNIDIVKITENKNPFCIENIKGKVNLRLVKDFTDALVTIER